MSVALALASGDVILLHSQFSHILSVYLHRDYSSLVIHIFDLFRIRPHLLIFK